MARRVAVAGSLSIVLLNLIGGVDRVRAEPYLALRSDLKCSSCHLNRTGGGGRTSYGAGYGRQSLPRSSTATWPDLFDGAITPRVRLGADLRGAYQVSFREEEQNLEEFVLSAAQLYAFVDLVPDRVSIYVDERVAPGGALNREAFALLRTGKAGLYFKAGRFFLPYGWRIQDDEAAIRRYTGFNMSSSDTGFEIGAEPGPWSTALSVTNGASGGAESNNGKQVALTATLLGKHWRAGFCGSSNDLPFDARSRAAGIIAGFHAGPIVGFGEWDKLRDDPGEGLPRTTAQTTHLEIAWLVTSGLTVRGWVGGFDPNLELPGDQQNQAGLGADWTVFPGIQVRAFYRAQDGPTTLPGSRDDRAVLELHAYF